MEVGVPSRVLRTGLGRALTDEAHRGRFGLGKVPGDDDACSSLGCVLEGRCCRACGVRSDRCCIYPAQRQMWTEPINGAMLRGFDGFRQVGAISFLRSSLLLVLQSGGLTLPTAPERVRLLIDLAMRENTGSWSVWRPLKWKAAPIQPRLHYKPREGPEHSLDVSRSNRCSSDKQKRKTPRWS